MIVPRRRRQEDVVACINLSDQCVLDSGSGPGHARSPTVDLFPNRVEGIEGLRPKARQRSPAGCSYP